MDSWHPGHAGNLDDKFNDSIHQIYLVSPECIVRPKFEAYPTEFDQPNLTN